MPRTAVAPPIECDRFQGCRGFDPDKVFEVPATAVAGGIAPVGSYEYEPRIGDIVQHSAERFNYRSPPLMRSNRPTKSTCFGSHSSSRHRSVGGTGQVAFGITSASGKAIPLNSRTCSRTSPRGP